MRIFEAGEVALPGKIRDKIDTGSDSYFDKCLRFRDGKSHKFAHTICVYDAGLRLEELSMERCTLPECDGHFMCGRSSDQKDEEGLYLPGKNPEWGCEPEGCLLVERGYFKSMKGGRFLKFESEQRGAVHWACAQDILTQETLQGMADGFSREIDHGRAA